MKNWEKNNQAKSLKELLQQTYPSSLTKRIELNEKFLTQAKQWPNQVLNFGFYEELEIIMVREAGEVRKIDVSKNKELKELHFANNELEGTLNLSTNARLERINVANNLLNQLKVHGDFSQKLKGIDKQFLVQKHNKEKIHPVKDIVVVLLDMGENDQPKELKTEKKISENLDKKKNEEISQLKNRLELLEQNLNERVGQKEEKIRELMAINEVNLVELQQSKNKLKEQEAENNRLQKQLDQYKKSESELKKELDQIKDEERKNKSRIQELKTALSEEQKVLIQEQKRAKELEKKLEAKIEISLKN